MSEAVVGPEEWRVHVESSRKLGGRRFGKAARGVRKSSGGQCTVT